MEIIGKFGINPILLAAQIVNFLIILYVLKRFLYKPILKVLKNREETIKQGLNQAEEARLLLEKTAEKEKNILKEAQLQARKILDDTRGQSQEMMRHAEETAKKQAESILKDARTQISFEARETERRLSAHVSKLAVQFLEKSVADFFTPEEQEMIIKNALKKMRTQAD